MQWLFGICTKVLHPSPWYSLAFDQRMFVAFPPCTVCSQIQTQGDVVRSSNGDAQGDVLVRIDSGHAWRSNQKVWVLCLRVSWVRERLATPTSQTSVKGLVRLAIGLSAKLTAIT